MVFIQKLGLFEYICMIKKDGNQSTCCQCNSNLHGEYYITQDKPLPVGEFYRILL